MKILYTILLVLFFNVCHSQQIKFILNTGDITFADAHRYSGDTIRLEIELIPNRNYYIAFKNKVAEGVAGYLYDNYLGLTYVVNPNDGYYEFTTDENPYSIDTERFYLRLVKCF
jgi:hypothetical protein